MNLQGGGKMAKKKEVKHTHDNGVTHSHVNGDIAHEHGKATVSTKNDGKIQVSTKKVEKKEHEQLTDVLKTWNKIGLRVREKCTDKYTTNNCYIILEDALKKVELAHK